MKKTDELYITGMLPPRFDEGFAEIAPVLGFKQGENGVRVSVQKGERLEVHKSADGISLAWAKPVQIYRALSLLRGAWQQTETNITETPCFDTGMMFDVSRNAVLRPDALKMFLRRMALMGMNVGMMYTEDTYEVPSEPYIGYMRGRYSINELREVDDFADALGIELMPCVQTLGHLNRVLHWPKMAGYADNAEVLLADDEKTYELLRRMLAAAHAPYRSNRIHICMDEAHGVGMGEHLRRHGYENPHEIIKRHLKRVKQITDELGLEPMMWADMYFRPDSPTNGYYDTAEPTQQSIDSVIPGIQLVYWDYYHNTEAEYAEMIKKHQMLTPQPLFAGGIWTFAGAVPDYDKTLQASVPALTACKKAGIPFVLATAWGDNGAETNLKMALPGMQLFAEFAYKGGYDEKELAERFEICCNGRLAPILGLSRFNTMPGMKPTPFRPVNAAKFMLYEDTMVRLFAKDVEGFDLEAHYKALKEEYAGYAEESGEWQPFMCFYAQLACVLEGKCRWHSRIAATVAADDKETARMLAQELLPLAEQTEKLRVLWREVWDTSNRPYGFEVIDGRLGAIRARLLTANERVTKWANGDEAETLPELREEVLSYTLRDGGTLFGSYAVSEIVSACKIDL